MSTIKLPMNLVSEAKRHAAVNCRSVPKQIEHWARIGKAAEDNPGLSYSALKEILATSEDVGVQS